MATLTITADERTLNVLAGACEALGLACRLMEATFGWQRDTAKGRKNPSQNRYVSTGPSPKAGTVRYFKTPPKGLEGQGQQEQQPAGSKPEEAPKALPTVDAVHDQLKALRPETLTEEKVRELHTLLAGTGGRSGMSVADLKALKAKLGVTAYGNKSEMARRIIEGARRLAQERAGGGVGDGDQGDQRVELAPDKVEAPPPPNPADDARQVAEAFGRLDASGDNLVGYHALGQATGLPPERLHAAVDELHRSGQWQSSGVEGRHGVSDEERAYHREVGGGERLGALSRKQEAPAADTHKADIDHVVGLASKAAEASSATPEQKAAYQKSVASVMDRMPPTAASRVAKNLKGFRFVASASEVVQASFDSTRDALASNVVEARKFVQQMMQAANELGISDADRQRVLSEFVQASDQELMTAAVVMFSRFIEPAARASIEDDTPLGCYSAVSQELTGNGGPHESLHSGPEELSMMQGDSQDQLYAHELTHAIDGPDKEVSGSSEWVGLWRQELNGGDGLSLWASDSGSPLTSYAQTSPSEGLAEFGRLLYGGAVELGEVSRRFPKASAFFQGRGLWPTPKQEAQPAGARPEVDETGV